jgi:hypothetical protein
MLVVLLDANVLLSAVISTRGPITDIMNAWAAQRFVVVASQHLLEKVERNMARPYFADQLGVAERQQYLEGLRTRCRCVALPPASPRVATHTEDDQILTTAVAGGVDYFVTGDRQLLALVNYQGIPIIRPTAFAEILRVAT